MGNKTSSSSYRGPVCGSCLKDYGKENTGMKQMIMMMMCVCITSLVIGVGIFFISERSSCSCFQSFSFCSSFASSSFICIFRCNLCYIFLSLLPLDFCFSLSHSIILVSRVMSLISVSALKSVVSRSLTFY